VIYKGKKQEDGSKTLGDLNFNEGDFMVVMCAKKVRIILHHIILKKRKKRKVGQV
jgi:hypothetical protein